MLPSEVEGVALSGHTLSAFPALYRKKAASAKLTSPLHTGGWHGPVKPYIPGITSALLPALLPLLPHEVLPEGAAPPVLMYSA